MQDAVRQTVGSIAIAWNQAEAAVSSMIGLYLDVDRLTFDLLVKPLRAQDREKLLKAVVAAKEFDAAIKDEIDKALKRTQICRENRNKVLHRLGELDGHLTDSSAEALQRVLVEIEAECTFLDELRLRIAPVLFDRNAREVPNDENRSGGDELRPMVEFISPDRPGNPRQMRFERLEVVE